MFGYETTTDELLEGRDLSGLHVLVTGASTGLGLETARALAAHGANVTMAARPGEKADGALETVRAAAAKGASVELYGVDLASLASVRACSDAIVAGGRPINVLIANAGVMACPQGKTADGFETQFGTNHLGHFVFVNRLLPLVLAGAPSRIVNLSSAGHRFSDADLDDPGFERTSYDPWMAYGRSKTANILFAVALDARLRDRGARACAVHPGGIRTELGRHLDRQAMEALTSRMPAGEQPRFKSIPQGAATSIWAAVVADAGEIGGRYCEDCSIGKPTDDPLSRSGIRSYALDAARAEALWKLSEEMVGEKFAR